MLKSFTVKVTTDWTVVLLIKLSVHLTVHSSPWTLSRHPSGWPAASHPVEAAFPIQLGLLCLCSQTVFPFIPLSAHSVYFGALLHHGA